MILTVLVISIVSRVPAVSAVSSQQYQWYQQYQQYQRYQQNQQYHSIRIVIRGETSAKNPLCPFVIKRDPALALRLARCSVMPNVVFFLPYCLMYFLVIAGSPMKVQVFTPSIFSVSGFCVGFSSNVRHIRSIKPSFISDQRIATLKRQAHAVHSCINKKGKSLIAWYWGNLKRDLETAFSRWS